MPRPLRIFIPDVTVHVMQRGVNRGRTFEDAFDYQMFLDLLRAASRRYEVAVHAYTLMTNHYHLMVTPGHEDALPRTMQQVAGRYAEYYNRKYERIGTFWNERYRGRLILDERYWLTCLRYVEQNPVRAGLVHAADDYRWSSYRTHAFGIGGGWLSEHPVFTALGATEEARQLTYRTLCGVSVSDSDLRLFRHTRGQTPGQTPARSVRVSSDSGTDLPAP